MLEQTTHRTYLAAIKPWKIRNMVEGYLAAWQIFHKCHHGKGAERNVPSFETLSKISDILYQVKEDHHLLFRRADRAAQRLEQHKMVPSYSETTFIDHVGLLFHKAMVAKELRYILERYAHDERNWNVHFNELKNNLERIETLFMEGLDLVASLVRNAPDNVLLLAYLIEHRRTVAKCFGIRPGEVVTKLVAKNSQPLVYYRVAQYYYESGWYERAKEAIRKALDKSKDEAATLRLFEQIEAKLNKQKGRSQKRLEDVPEAESDLVES
ncbi:hypothetical protein HUU05_27230 [candidate division KSB1 bacterium]|nr:hypothetical protein [candidate division KSB1 bacterium]